MNFAVIDNATDTVVRRFEAPDDFVVPDHKYGPEHPERIVPVVVVPPPEYDPATQILVPAPPQVTPTELREGMAVVAKPVPDEVPTWALREVCAQSTLRSPNLKLVIDAAIAGMAEPAKSIAAGRWNSKPTIRRHDPLTLQLIAGLGLTEAAADALFVAAANLN